MSNATTEHMLSAVQTAKENAKRAEQEYDRRADRLQDKASRDIELFGGNAVNQVADIVSESRKICDTLYAEYQTLVHMLDAQCRPMLALSPDARAVRAVKELIKWLNDESEIQNNFEASLNSRSLGGVASRRYIPSIENKMIQSFWEATYSALPGREEAERLEAEEAKRQEEIERNAKIAATATAKSKREKRHQIINAYRKDYAQWEQACKEADRQRDDEIEKRLTALQEAVEAEATEKCEKVCLTHRQEIDRQTERKSAAESALATLDFFNFSGKKAQKGIIKDATQLIERETAAIANAEKQMNAEIVGAEQKAQAKKESIRQVVCKEIKYPMQPKRPECMHGKRLNNSDLFQDILDEMQPGYLYSASDLNIKISVLGDLSEQRILALMRQLADIGEVERIEYGRTFYFQLAD